MGVSGGWRKLNKKEGLYSDFSPPSIYSVFPEEALVLTFLAAFFAERMRKIIR